MSIQKAQDAKRPSVFQEVLEEGDRVLAPSMWEWILKTSEPVGRMDLVGRIASLLASHHGLELTGGWGEASRYWWVLKGCRFCYDKLDTTGLFYFFQCSRADFSSLPSSVQKVVWQEAETRLTVLLRKPEICSLNKYRLDEARLHVEAVLGLKLSQLLLPYWPSAKAQHMGSREALEDWIKAEYGKQYAKRGLKTCPDF